MRRSIVKTDDWAIIWDSLSELTDASFDHSQPFRHGWSRRRARDRLTTGHLSVVVKLGRRVRHWELLAGWPRDGEDNLSIIRGSIRQLGHAAPLEHQRKQARHPLLSQRNGSTHKYVELFRGDIAPEGWLRYHSQPHGQSSYHRRSRPRNLGYPCSQGPDEIWLLNREKSWKIDFLISKKSDGAGVWAQVARATIWSTNHYTTPSLFDGLLHVFSYKEVLITKLKH